MFQAEAVYKACHSSESHVKDEKIIESDVVRKREEALKRMLSTPHQPHKLKSDSRAPKASSAKRKSVPKS